MATSKKKTKKKKAAPQVRAARDPFAVELQRMRRLLASARHAAPNRRDGVVRGAGVAAAATSGATTVPRNSVGAAVQAAVTFENATGVTATASDDTRQTFDIAWR